MATVWLAVAVAAFATDRIIVSHPVSFDSKPAVRGTSVVDARGAVLVGQSVHMSLLGPLVVSGVILFAAYTALVCAAYCFRNVASNTRSRRAIEHAAFWSNPARSLEVLQSAFTDPKPAVFMADTGLRLATEACVTATVVMVFVGLWASRQVRKRKLDRNGLRKLNAVAWIAIGLFTISTTPYTSFPSALGLSGAHKGHI